MAAPRHDPDDGTPQLQSPRLRARPDFITDLPSPDFPDGIPSARNSPVIGGA